MRQLEPLRSFRSSGPEKGLGRKGLVHQIAKQPVLILHCAKHLDPKTGDAVVIATVATVKIHGMDHLLKILIAPNVPEQKTHSGAGHTVPLNNRLSDPAIKLFPQHMNHSAN